MARWLWRVRADRLGTKKSSALWQERRPSWLSAGRGTALAVTVLSLLVQAVLVAPSATACTGQRATAYVVNPVYALYQQHYWNSNWCEWSYGPSTPMSCAVQPLVEIGPPIVNGYREGYYTYTCDLALGSHTDSHVGATGPVGEPTCQSVPDVYVLGQHVPGTGQTYCAPSDGVSQPVPLDTPDAVQSRGLFWISPPSFYGYFDVAQTVTTCNAPGWSGSETTGYVSVGSVASVRYLNCRP